MIANLNHEYHMAVQLLNAMTRQVQMAQKGIMASTGMPLC